MPHTPETKLSPIQHGIAYIAVSGAALGVVFFLFWGPGAYLFN